VVATLPDLPTRSTLAVDVAAAEAAARGLPLRLVRTRVPPPDRDVAGRTAPQPDATVEAVLRRVADAYPGLVVGVSVAVGDRTSAVIDEARQAELVVVSHERDERSDASIATAVAAEADCPVIIVPEGSYDASAAGRGPIVVGVKGDDRDALAVAFGLREADLHRVPLHLMHVWQSIPDLALVSVDPFVYGLGEARRDAEQLIETALDGLLDRFPQVPVRRVPFCHSDVLATLCDASARASLLVLGPARPVGTGRGRLGRVGRRLIDESRCPVAFVPGRSAHEGRTSCPRSMAS
jgi:nucleotide-binding universal stress UspA family protein